MNMSWIDWAIVFAVFTSVLAAARFTMRYTKSVADFLAANRCAGRYLLVTAEGIACVGAIAFVAQWEVFKEAGFTANFWWQYLSTPAILIISLTGYVYYRFRQTRAMTLAQYFEMRYSKNFRIFAGILCFVSGTLNFGIFPAVGSRFFIYFCGLPDTTHLFGLEIPVFPLIMLILLSTAVSFVCMGGQIAVMITDFMQGFFCNIVFIIISILAVLLVSWGKMSEAMLTAPAGQSMINPLEGGQLENFNVWFYIIGMAGAFYGTMSWQGTQGYNAAAKNAHEAQMSKVLISWRFVGTSAAMMLLPLLAFTVMNHPEFNNLADKANETLSTIPSKTIQNQMAVPVALSLILPIGIKGLLCAVMLAAFLSTHTSYLHSWGSIFIQDVLMPLKKKPLTASGHLKLLRTSMIGVAIFIFFFSLLFPQTAPIIMFWTITGAIFVGGSGAAIVGGLYWKKGTTLAAFSAMIVGSVLAVSSIIVDQFWPSWYGHKFPLNAQYLLAIVMVFSASVYVIISLIQNKDFDMDRLLHKGKYTIEEDSVKLNPQGPSLSIWQRGLQKLGLSREFTYWDKVIFMSTIVWNMSWFAIFVIGTIYAVIFGVSDAAWLKYWNIVIWVFIVAGVITTVWMAAGGIYDVRVMFKTLATMIRDDKDDGTVTEKESLADVQQEQLQQSETK